MKIDADKDVGEQLAARERQAAEKLLVCSDLLALSALWSRLTTNGEGKTLRHTVSAMERRKRLHAVRDNGPPART
jgi:hypothetical protein